MPRLHMVALTVAPPLANVAAHAPTPVLAALALAVVLASFLASVWVPDGADGSKAVTPTDIDADIDILGAGVHSSCGLKPFVEAMSLGLLRGAIRLDASASDEETGGGGGGGKCCEEAVWATGPAWLACCSRAIRMPARCQKQIWHLVHAAPSLQPPFFFTYWQASRHVFGWPT
eukprot:CAMPEP_0203913558 /NCGR_PEP_ID=MMETSP0359-20131031/54539_1 /ASSEMBLY_ACC=CAM_ASM_000338 /TAXON_ID=268821 /ORGANISM="Scrippsiella Hangoei, Strain SHTV-5" /LENGTH=173 /DNA_ID=CAMNT_0050839725 /DNA_START=1 /DNA_END=520 /DNA_ORIENTATION=+